MKKIYYRVPRCPVLNAMQRCHLICTYAPYLSTMSHDNEDPDRLGGYDAITAVASDLLLRIQADPQLGRIWRIVEKMASSVKSSSWRLEINNRYFPRVSPLIQKGICMKVVLFLCTGNYYRSRFVEEMFNFLAPVKCPGWTAVSRGIALDLGINNVGPIATSAAQALQKRGIIFNRPLARMPLQLGIPTSNRPIISLR
jgi:hypothetical protein